MSTKKQEKQRNKIRKKAKYILLSGDRSSLGFFILFYEKFKQEFPAGNEYFTFYELSKAVAASSKLYKKFCSFKKNKVFI